PYVGKFVNTLTLAEVKTLDCGSKTLPQFPEQVPAPGARMPLLSEVFDLVKRYHAYGVKLNIETKVEAGAPTETAPMEQFVQVAEAHRLGLKVIPWTIDDHATVDKVSAEHSQAVVLLRAHVAAATAEPASPTGWVQFSVDGHAYGPPVPVHNGVAVLVVPASVA